MNHTSFFEKNMHDQEVNTFLQMMKRIQKKTFIQLKNKNDYITDH